MAITGSTKTICGVLAFAGGVAGQPKLAAAWRGMAERVGVEPTVELPRHRFSRPAL